MEITYSKELEFAEELARESGRVMLQYFHAEDMGTVVKTDLTPVTAADTEINDLVISRVKERFPRHGVHGEEASFGTDREWVWVCDPVDGTMPFSLGLPLSTFSLALTRNGEPLVGVVYDPFGDKLYTARKGGGAFVNGKPLRVSDHQLERSYVDLAMMHGLPGSLPIGDIRSALVDRKVFTFTLFSTIISTMKVASGEFTAAYFAFRKPEDMAAAKVIVEEAGGRVTDIDGNDQRYDRQINGGLVSNGVVHEEMLEVIKAAKIAPEP
jgi:myo-inositol-1(or 4)-monophosphatase